MATILATVEQAMAATTVAATAMAAVTQASHGGGVTTDQGKGDQGDERRTKFRENASFLPPKSECTSICCAFHATVDTLD